MLRPRIVIVGAGVSGLSAARKLIENGFLNTTILEAEPRIGGRINTIDFDGKNIELGAQWCHGQTNNIVYELTKDFNVLGQSKNAYIDLPFYISSGDSIDPKLGNRCLEIFYEIVFDEKRLKRETGSLGDYFVRRYKEMIDLEFCDANDLEIARKLVPWFHGMTLGYDAGKSWFEISAEGSTHYELCDGDPLLNWKNYGYKTLLEIIMKSFPDESKSLPIRDKIELNKKAVRIDWNDEIKIECSDGTIYNADHVIVTTSLGVLKETYKVLFNPELPEAKQTAIENLGFGTVNKIFLKFPEAFWKDEDIGFNFIWENPEDFKEYPWLESVFGFYVIDNEPKTLLGWSVGEQTEAFENISDNELIDGCAFALNKFLGKFYVIPHPIKATRSKWGSNPNFRGSYSFRSVKTDEKNTSAEQLGTPIKNSLGNLALLFAGEATHEHFYSTVHGALESGFREAQRIIELYK